MGFPSFSHNVAMECLLWGAPHNRHTFATLLLKRNVNIVAIQKLMGHKRLESTQIYLHVTSKDLTESINLL